MRYFLFRTPMSCTRSGDRELVLVKIEENQTEEDAVKKFTDFPNRVPVLKNRGYTYRELDLSTGVITIDTVIC